MVKEISGNTSILETIDHDTRMNAPINKDKQKAQGVMIGLQDAGKLDSLSLE